MLRKLVGLMSVVASFFLASTIQASTVTDLLHEGPVAGNPHGSVTVVEFFDYQCSHCINMAPAIAEVIKSNPHVRVVFKDLPIRGAVSDFAARAALAANKQGAYYRFNHALLTANQPLTQDAILEIAKSEHLNVKKLTQDMKSSSVNAQIKANYQLAQTLRVTGTPAFFIAKTDAPNMSKVDFVLGEMTKAQLQDAINNAR